MSTPPNPQSPPRPATLAESSSGSMSGSESFKDALPPAPPSSGVPAPTFVFPETQSGDSSEVPLSIPGYEILGELGRGGMGVVYKARQLQLGRLVALKMSRSAELTNEDMVRFRAEAEAVARLRHANIVQIFEVGQCQGRPYFAFEYVDGGSLADFLRGTPQPGRACAELVEKLARAIHVAHQAGIIHRDLKPANVLLSGGSTVSDTKVIGGQNQSAGAMCNTYLEPHSPTLPLAPQSPFANPKIADFGVAKRLDKHSLHTATGAVLGTPNYMAPEQAWGSDKRRPVGPQADVYALGAILYEMITGRPPFLGETPLDTLQQVVMQEPVAPSRLQPKISRDLETICLKCLQKEPARRYADADALADDLRRFLEDRPVLAKPAGTITRLLRWRRRNPAVAALLLVALVLLAAGTAVSTYFAIEATSAAAQADKNAREAVMNLATATENARQANENLRIATESQKKAEVSEKLARDRLRERDRINYVSIIANANRALVEDKLGQVLELLDVLRPAKADDEDLRGFEWYYMRRRVGGKNTTLLAHDSPVTALTFSQDGAVLASANAGQNKQGQAVPVEVCLWQPQSGRRLAVFKGHEKSVVGLAFNNDGKHLASASEDGTVRVWDKSQGNKPVFVCKSDSPFTGVQFTPDGGFLLTSSVDKTVRFWETSKGELRGVLPAMPDAVECLAVHPTGETVAAGSRDGTVIIWDTGRGHEKNRLKVTAVGVVHLAWHPKGKHLATASADGTVCIWDITTNELVVPPLHYTARVNRIAFSPDGNYLATASDDKSVLLLSAASLARHKQYQNDSDVTCLGFGGADGGLLASAGRDGKVIIRPFGIKPAALVWEKHSARVDDVCWNNDGTLLASCRGLKFTGQDDPYAGSEVILWNTATGRSQPPLTAHTMLVYKASFQPGGKLLATASRDGTIRLWDAASGDLLKEPLSKNNLPYYTLTWSPDGTRLAATCDVEADGKVSTRIIVWDLPTRNQVLAFVHPREWMESLVWSPDGKWLAGASTAADSVWLWRVDTGKLVHEFAGHSAPVKGLAFSADSRWLASASLDETARLWDVQDKKSAGVVARHSGAVRAVCFHPRGDRLATAGDDKLVRLWDLATHREVFTFSGHAGPVNALAFHPNGEQLATASSDASVRIWDATPLPEDIVARK